MNASEAVKIINGRIEFGKREYSDVASEYIEALEMAIEAFRKQEPMKPVPLEYDPLRPHGWEYGCPACGNAVGFNKYAVEYTDNDPFCPSCGRKLDWED